MPRHFTEREAWLFAARRFLSADKSGRVDHNGTIFISICPLLSMCSRVGLKLRIRMFEKIGLEMIRLHGPEGNILLYPIDEKGAYSRAVFCRKMVKLIDNPKARTGIWRKLEWSNPSRMRKGSSR